MFFRSAIASLLVVVSSLRQLGPTVPRISKFILKSTAVSNIIDLTNDGGIKKELLSFGQGKSVETGDILAIKYEARLKDETIPFAKADKETCIVKDGSFIKGWDLSISSMKIGEKAKFLCSSKYAYGAKGIDPIIPPNSDIILELSVQAWLGNQLNPDSLFQKDLDIDPFVASTPEAIQDEFDQMQARKIDKYKGNIIEIYWNRIKNISFGFGGSGFFTSQSGEKAPWYLNPNITFPTMIAIVLAAFITVFSTGGVKEKGLRNQNLEVASTSTVIHSSNFDV